MGVSVSTYYKYRRRWKREGDAGLLNKRLRAEEGIKQLPYNARKALLEIVRENPEWGAAKLQKKMAELSEDFTEKTIYDELVNMRLNTKMLRLAYVERIGQLKPEQKEMLEKEILRDTQKELDKADYVEGLQKNIEKRQVEKITQETGRVISQLKHLSPNLKGKNLYEEIAGGLEKLEGGKEIADMFKAMMMRVGDDIVEEKRPIDEMPLVVEETPVAAKEPTAEATPVAEDKPAVEQTTAAPEDKVEPSKASEIEPSVKEETIVESGKAPKSKLESAPEIKATPVAESRPIKKIDIGPISSEKIDINKKAIKGDSKESILNDMQEYEKRLMKKFKK
jgi:hypothetical protein